MAKKKKKGSLLGKFIGLLFLAAAIYCLFTIGMNLLDSVKLADQKKLVEEQLKQVQSENNELEATKAKLENEDYVQTYARGEYMFSLEDEKVFYLPSSSKEE